MHTLAPFLPAFIALLGGLPIWILIAIHAGERRRGLQAVEAQLQRLGETAVTIENVPLHKLVDKAGLTGVHAFRVTASDRAGASTSHLWAYDPGLLTATSNGLKRLAHGIWIPA